MFVLLLSSFLRTDLAHQLPSVKPRSCVVLFVSKHHHELVTVRVFPMIPSIAVTFPPLGDSLD